MSTSTLFSTKRWRAVLLIGTLALADLAIQTEHTAAQGLLPPPRPPSAMPPLRPPETMLKRMCGDLDAIFAARTAFFEAKVTPTVAQKTEWDAFRAAMRTIAREIKSRCEAPENVLPPIDDPVAMLAFHDNLTAQHTEFRRIERAAADRLMKVLTTDQQRKFAEALLAPPFIASVPHAMRGTPPL